MGYLKLSPVLLFPTSSQSEKTRFHQINLRIGDRLRQQMVDKEAGDFVDKDEKGRGYELSNGRYVPIEPEELEAVEVESTHTIDIDKFVTEMDIDKLYYERPYCVVPDGKSGEDANTRNAVVHKGALDDGVHLIVKAFALEMPSAELSQVLQQGSD